MILALESSCDETAVAVFDPNVGIVGEWIHSQIALHEKYGGVVPDLATREHLRNLGPLLERVRDEVGFSGIDQIAVTRGPGLAACLAMGLAAANALSLAWNRPVVGVNHLRAHAWSSFIEKHRVAPAGFPAALDGLLPHLALIVSGGNTLLCAIDVGRTIRVLSSTRDDAAGEALDKGAKLLGLGYPGGPLVEKVAAGGRPDAFDFPRGIGQREELDFSFSGLKTSLRYLLEKMSPAEIEARRADLAASYQQAVLDALARKTRAALRQSIYKSVGLSGGVANNRGLRAAIAREASRARVEFLAAEPRHSGDNAGMIAFAAWTDPQAARGGAPGALTIEPALELA